MSSVADYQSNLINHTRRRLEGASNVTLSSAQKAILDDPDVKGPSWVSRVSFQAPNDELDGPRSLLESVSAALGSGKDHYPKPAIEAVDARWTGYRPGVEEEAAEPAASEQEKYRKLMADMKRPLTIMFFHGGGHTFVTSTPIHSEP